MLASEHPINAGTRPIAAVLLDVENAGKSYGAVTALAEVSLHVREGEFVALLGPNGAGKTTLFQLLTGLFAPDRGRIRVDGHDIRRRPVAALTRMGVVFQQPTLDLDMTVGANLLFHARLHGVERGRARQRINDELTRLQLSDQIGVPCQRLSGGNRRKIELARALLPEPQLLLMDEPTVGLDPASRRSLLEYVHHLCAERRIGILWATHLVDEAERADRVLVLHQGKLLYGGAPDQLMHATGGNSVGEAFIKLTAATHSL